MVVFATLGYEEIDQLLVIVHAPCPPSEADWDEMMKVTRMSVTRIKCCLVVAGSSSLDAQKRRELADVVQGRNLKVSVMVASPIARGMVTALGWLVGGYRAFDMNDHEKAFDYMQVPATTRVKARRVVDEIQKRFGLGASAGKAATNR